MTDELNADPTAAAAGAAETAPSIDDLLTTAYDDIEAREAGGEIDTTRSVAERARDASGRFARGEETKPPAGGKETNTGQPETAAAGQPQGDQPPAATGAPQSWSDAAKAKWSTLPPDIQAEIAKRESDVQRGFQQRAEALQRFEGIDRAIAPYRQRIQALGMTEHQAVGTLMDLYERAGRDPIGYVKWFCKEVGLDPAAAFGGAADPQQSAGGPEWVDPQVKALTDQVRDLTSRLQAREQTEEKVARTSINAEIDRVAGQRDDKGNLLRPHWERLEADIARLIPLIRQDNPGASNRDVLEAAYDQALYRNPETRKAAIEAEKAAALADATARQQQAAKTARAANRLNTRPSATAGAGAPQRGRSIDETLGNAYDAIVGRA